MCTNSVINAALVGQDCQQPRLVSWPTARKATCKRLGNNIFANLINRSKTWNRYDRVDEDGEVKSAACVLQREGDAAVISSVFRPQLYFFAPLLLRERQGTELLPSTEIVVNTRHF